MTSKWGTDTTIKFIELYKENVCLWNVDSPDYKSRPVREAAYENLAAGMNMPGFTVQDVKNKIKNLRSTYCQEVKKIEESKRFGGPVYEPSLKWLNDIAPIFVYAKNGDHSITTNVEQDEDSTKADLKKIYQAETYSAKRTSSSNKTPINKRKKIIHQVLNDAHRSEAYDAFGKSVAMQLKSLSQERALMAQSQIQTLLTEYGIADLKDRQRSNDNCPTSFTFVSSQEEALSPSSHRSNDGSVSSMPESKYFEQYPVELLNSPEDNL